MSCRSPRFPHFVTRCGQVPPVTCVPTRGLALKSPAVLNSSARIVHTSKLPDGATQKQGIAMLQDKEFFLRCNPHMDKFEARGQVSEPELPESIKPLGPTTLYNVTDIVETLPKGLWSSNVESTYEFTDIELGTFCALKSPMNVVMHTFWSIEEKDGGLELVEACEIKCSRLLIGIVKSLNEGGCEYPCTISLWNSNMGLVLTAFCTTWSILNIVPPWLVELTTVTC